MLVENTLLRHASSSNATFMLSPDDKKVYTRPTLGRLARQLSRQISLLRESIERIENKLCAICPDTGKYIAKERLLSVHRNESYSTPYGKRPSN